MKVADLQTGKTYVGKNGKRRNLFDIRIARISDLYRMGSLIACYDMPEGGIAECSERAFARWAEREATHEEKAP
jgi:hypothetical protein